MIRSILQVAARVGERTALAWRKHRAPWAVAFAAAWMAGHPRRWPQPIRDILARQILFTGVDALRIVAGIAFLIGLSVVLQTHVVLTRLGQSAWIGPILVAILVREAGPLLVNFIVIARSGTAIASELSSMRVAGEIGVLDSLGLDPFPVLVLPRVIGVAISVFCLTLVFLAVSFLSGYAGGILLHLPVGSPARFLDGILGALRPADVVSLLAKTLVSGLMTGAICSMEGLSVRGALSEIPQAATRGVVRSFASLFLVSAVISLLVYLS